MCGILGEIRFDNSAVDLHRFGVALDRLQRRGPDAAAVWSIEPSVALGHRRLAILDLDPRSDQPFLDAVNENVLVYNGEIYNFAKLREELAALGHVFRTESDTEVLLAALLQWGTEALPRLNGMFAFAWWNIPQKRLLIARDRIGVKPLYFDFSSNQRIAFSSTLSPLIELRETESRLDTGALGAYLSALYLPGVSTAITGISQLAPGTYAWIDTDGFKSAAWWSAPVHRAKESASTEGQVLAKLDSLLGEAVQRRLVSDVPVGTLLSGGVDSSLVAAYVQRSTGERSQTFTIGFKDKAHDESETARAVAKHLGTRHHEFIVGPNDLADLALNITDHFDEPFADASAIPTLLLAKLCRPNATVVLCGDGGDELFGGYQYYRRANAYGTAQRFPHWLRRASAQLAPHFGHLTGMALAGLRYSTIPDVFAFMRSASKFVDWTSLLRHPAESVSSHFSALSARCTESDPRRIGMMIDLLSYLPNDILVKGDRSTMAFSVEGRHPFLDVHVVEYALSLPTDQIFARSESKWILRSLMRNYIPEDICRLPKHGFTVPIREWFRGPLKSFVRDHLNSHTLRDDPLLHSGAVEKLISEHESHSNNHENLIWAMLVYRLWFTKNTGRLCQ